MSLIFPIFKITQKHSGNDFIFTIIGLQYHSELRKTPLLCDFSLIIVLIAQCSVVAIFTGLMAGQLESVVDRLYDGALGQTYGVPV